MYTIAVLCRVNFEDKCYYGVVFLSYEDGNTYATARRRAFLDLDKILESTQLEETEATEGIEAPEDAE